jgi:hypothetical protein
MDAFQKELDRSEKFYIMACSSTTHFTPKRKSERHTTQSILQERRKRESQQRCCVRQLDRDNKMGETNLDCDWEVVIFSKPPVLTLSLLRRSRKNFLRRRAEKKKKNPN